MKTLPISFPELPFAVEEAFNRLRINVGFIGKSTRTIMITGSLAAEGKSSVAINLWHALAETGVSTLYLDLDLRASATLSRYLYKPCSSPRGIEHYLSGKAGINDVVYATSEPNAFIIPCTGTFANPSALLEDPSLPQLLEDLKKEYRYVIVDTPPLIQVSDGMRIASLCDGAILVVRNGYTSKRAVRRSIQILSDSGCPLLGTVLNRIEDTSGRRGYGYGYGYGYGHKYGYGYGQEKPKRHWHLFARKKKPAGKKMTKAAANRKAAQRAQSARKNSGKRYR